MPKKQTIRKVSHRYQGCSDLGEVLGSQEMLCVCVSLLWFCYVAPSETCIPPTAPFTGSRPVPLVSASSLLCINWLLSIFPALLTWKEDQSNSGWSSCIWHQRSNSLRNVLIPSFTLTSVLHYSMNPALFSPVRQHGLHCMRDGKLMKDDAWWKKKTRTKISKGNFCSQFSGKWRVVVHCIQ